MAKLSLLLCYYGENNLPSTLFKICTEFNRNSVCDSEARVHNFCNACNQTLGVLCWWLSTVFASSFVMETHIQNKWERTNKFLFWEDKENEIFSLKFFSKQSVKTRWWVVFFVLRNADFVKFRNASEHSWEKILLIRVRYREKAMRHGWSATMTCC